MAVDANVTIEQPGPDNMDLRILLARFETKLDLVLSQHDGRLTDHEARVRILEDRKTVTPIGLLASSATVVAILGGTLTFLDRIYA